MLCISLKVEMSITILILPDTGLTLSWDFEETWKQDCCRSYEMHTDTCLHARWQCNQIMNAFHIVLLRSPANHTFVRTRPITIQLLVMTQAAQSTRPRARVDNRELKHQRFSRRRRQTEVWFTSGRRFAPSRAAVATRRRRHSGLFGVAWKTWVYYR